MRSEILFCFCFRPDGVETCFCLDRVETCFWAWTCFCFVIGDSESVARIESSCSACFSRLLQPSSWIVSLRFLCRLCCLCCAWGFPGPLIGLLVVVLAFRR